MKRPLDQTSDPGFSRLQVLAQRYPKMAEMSKHASLDPEEFSGLPDASFAWPGVRAFPIHSKEHAAISYGYSKLAEAIPSDVKETLEKAAALYGIETEKVFEEPVQIEKVASDEYLLPDARRFRVKEASDVPVMERAYHERYVHMTIDERAEAGMRLVKVAEQYSVELSPSTHKIAGFTITSTQRLRDWVEARKMASIKVGSPIAEAFQSFADGLRGAPPYIHEREQQTKLAGLISDLDEQAGITGYYGNKLPDPLRTVFNTEHRTQDFMKIGSALQNKALLAELPLSFWQDALGEDVVKDIAPGGVLNQELLAQVLPTLPDDMKAVLERQLAAYNK